MSKIAVFPAAGKLGTSIYNHLLQLTEPSNLILISRDPSKIPSKYVESGVITRQADYDAPDTLAHAFDDVSHLLLVSYPSIQNEHRFEVHKKAISAARNSTPGVRHIFYTSLAFGGDCTPFSAAHVMQAHLATERYLTSIAYPETEDGQEQKPFSFTAIREGIYSESFPMYTSFAYKKDDQSVFKIPYDGSGPGVAWAKIDDLGEATAKLVHSYYSNDRHAIARYEDKTILLSGHKVWSLAETVALLIKVMKRDIEIEQVGVEEYTQLGEVRENLQSHGPGDVPREWATSFQAIEDGETAVVSGELGRLLGREPEGFEVTVRQMIEGTRS